MSSNGGSAAGSLGPVLAVHPLMQLYLGSNWLEGLNILEQVTNNGKVYQC